MEDSAAKLLKLLDLEPSGADRWRGYSPQAWKRVYGGQVIAQALVAATRTVDARERPCHSLHAYFILGGDPTIPIEFSVERIRDGKSFATRRCIAVQRDA
ncbi:MAG: thioesterase family protein, partial [Methylocystis sp.]|nr:thioesterase family protein [Methylocystis sp.]